MHFLEGDSHDLVTQPEEEMLCMRVGCAAILFMRCWGRLGHDFGVMWVPLPWLFFFSGIFSLEVCGGNDKWG